MNRVVQKAATTLLAAGFLVGTVSSVSPAMAAVKKVPAPRPVIHESLVILTGGMLKRPGWPMVYPERLILPKGYTIDLTIRNFDDGTAPLAKGTYQYDKVTGTIGNFELVNGRRVTSLNPGAVSHTITIGQLGINIPIPIKSTVEVKFHVNKKGTFYWQCMAPCGSGSSGWGGPMSTNGWMKGSIVVQ